MKIVTLSGLLIFPLLLCGQSPFVKQWDYRFGGTEYDYLTSFQQTLDGGFILGGYSTSGISGDKTQPSWGSLDYWIVKTDENGIKQWDKRFGGFDSDVLSTVLQTQDGGYILAGTSNSQSGGDKTQPSRGMNDYWIVKTDSAGNKIWDKRYGGIYDELLATILQTPDHGYILGGYSGSPAGGDKTQPNQGFNDYWIVRTDSIGTVLWDKTFGGSDHDFLLNMIITSDNGFLLGGASGSPAGGDKSQNTWGADDVWIIKTDSLGNKQWDADYGGFNYDQLNALFQSQDGSYVLACYSSSNIGGDKTQNCWGQSDVWLVKINSGGTILWDNDLGGTDIEDGIGSIFQNSDGNYFVICNSYSPVSGDKSESNLGLAQAWLVKTDTLGNKLWDKTIFTDPEQKVFPLMIQTSDGCYAVAEATYGDSAGVKTQHNRDSTLSSTDFWIIRYCDSTAVSVAAFSAMDSICPGTCVDFTNLSLNANSYQWNFPGAIPSSSTDENPSSICYSSPGSYDVSLIASNGTVPDTLTLSGFITVFPFPASQGISQNGDTLFANTGAVFYQWYHDGNLVSGATDYFYLATEGGDYNVVATDINGCEVEAAIFDVVANTDQLNNEDKQVQLFPIPVTDRLNIKYRKMQSENTDVQIFDTFGNKIATFCCNPTAIDCRSLPGGIYFFEIQNLNSAYRTYFIKQ